MNLKKIFDSSNTVARYLDSHSFIKLEDGNTGAEELFCTADYYRSIDPDFSIKPGKDYIHVAKGNVYHCDESELNLRYTNCLGRILWESQPDPIIGTDEGSNNVLGCYKSLYNQGIIPQAAYDFINQHIGELSFRTFDYSEDDLI